MDYTGKRLLILGGQELHNKVVNAAREMGVYTIVTDYLVGSPAKLIADESIMLSILDADEIVDWCRENNIDGVVNYSNDPAQKVLPEICSRLGLPCYGTAEQTAILTDKVKFKKALIENGVDVIKEFSPEDVDRGAVEYPVLVKPNDSRGSRGQTICFSQENIREAIEYAKRESSTGTVIIEQYLGGKQDFSVTYFVCGGKPYLIRLCDRYTGRLEENLNRQCIGSICPSKYADMYMKNVHSRVVSFIKALGIANGPVFMQGFIDGDTVRFYDPGFRFPGGEYELLLKQIYGIDFAKAMVELALSGAASIGSQIREDLYTLNGLHSVQLPIAGNPGVVGRFEGLDEIRSHSQVVVASSYYEPGETVPDTGDVKRRIARVSMVIDENHSVRDSVEFVQKTLRVTDAGGGNMLASPLDLSRLTEY